MQHSPLALRMKWMLVPFPKMSPNTGWGTGVKSGQRIIIVGFHMLS